MKPLMIGRKTAVVTQDAVTQGDTHGTKEKEIINTCTTEASTENEQVRATGTTESHLPIQKKAQLQITPKLSIQARATAPQQLQEAVKSDSVEKVIQSSEQVTTGQSNLTRVLDDSKASLPKLGINRPLNEPMHKIDHNPTEVEQPQSASFERKARLALQTTVEILSETVLTMGMKLDEAEEALQIMQEARDVNNSNMSSLMDELDAMAKEVAALKKDEPL